jgi:hypothetical protein
MVSLVNTVQKVKESAAVSTAKYLRTSTHSLRNLQITGLPEKLSLKKMW